MTPGGAALPALRPAVPSATPVEPVRLASMAVAEPAPAAPHLASDQGERPRRRLRRPRLASAVGLTVAILLSGSAAYADPGGVGPNAATGVGPNAAAGDSGPVGAPPAAPDSGSRPQSGGGVFTPPGAGGLPPAGGTTGTLPGGTGSSGLDPVATQIATMTQNVQLLAAQASAAQQTMTDAQQALGTAKQNVQIAQEIVDLLTGEKAHSAGRAYVDRSKMPDKLGALAAERQRLAVIAPWLGDASVANGEASGRDLHSALALLAQAQSEYQSVLATANNSAATYRSLKQQYDQLVAQLELLRNQHAGQLEQINNEMNQSNAAFDGQIGGAVNGWAANPRAIEAVRFALRQLGKPYVWGADGPNAYDCAGLVRASYASVGVSLSHVANDQYLATAGMPVTMSQLLPGDLIFYGTRPGDPTSIYHVAMYVGNGKMVQAPDQGIPVQVAAVARNGIYGATRVLPAVRVQPAPAPTAAPKPTPTSGGGQTGQPSGKPTPTSSGAPTPTRSGTPSAHPTTSSSTPTPGASTSKECTKPTPSGTPSASRSPSPSPSPSPSKSTAAAC